MNIETVKKDHIQSQTSNSRIFVQYIAAYSVTLCMFMTGLCWGWTGPMYVIFLSESPPFNVTETELSWTASLGSLSSIPGTIITTCLVDVIGRKTILLFSSIPFFMAWIITYFATNIIMLDTARLINGIAFGSVLNIAPMYIGEIASPKIRGHLSNLIGFQLKLGVLFAYTICSYVPFRTSSLIFACVPIIFVLTFIWMPESPYFYLMKNDRSKAIESLRYFHGKDYNYAEEISMKTIDRKSSFWTLFLVPSNRKSLYISLALFSTQQFCGISALLVYAPVIFEQLNYSLDPKICNLIFALTSVVMIFITGFFVDRIGRRILMMISAIFVAIGLFTIGLYFYLKDAMHLDVESFSLIPTIMLMLFPFSYGIGLNSLPFVCISELFSIEFKAIASCINVVYSSIVAFFMIKLYHTVEVNYGLYTNLFAFTFFSLIGAVYIYFFLPETKRQTLETIQMKLNK